MPSRSKEAPKLLSMSVPPLISFKSHKSCSINVNARSRFLSLPREVRDMIYSYIFDLPEHENIKILRYHSEQTSQCLVHTTPSPKACSRHQPCIVVRNEIETRELHPYYASMLSITRVCKRTRDETLSLWQACNSHITEQYIIRDEVDSTDFFQRAYHKIWPPTVSKVIATMPMMMIHPLSRNKAQWLRNHNMLTAIFNFNSADSDWPGDVVWNTSIHSSAIPMSPSTQDLMRRVMTTRRIKNEEKLNLIALCWDLRPRRENH